MFGQEIAVAKYGWIRDLPDQRDLAYKPLHRGLFESLPASVDLRDECPPVYDQGQLGSCTANAIAAHLDFNRQKQAEKFISPSRLFIYYNERKDQGTINSDAGSTIRESAKAVKSYGAPKESEWPYNIKKFTDKPTAKDYSDGIKNEAISYQRIARKVNNMKACLAEGYPFVIGFTVYESFDNITSQGYMDMPAPGEAVLGGHAVMVVGYTNDGYWIVRNSWGTSWGDRGYFYMPEKYLLNTKLSSDFWTLRKVT